MYIPRYVFDANRINTRGYLQGMNELERLHDLKVIEFLCTSTMNVDLKGAQRQEKANQYRRIGSDGVFYFTQDGGADATWGAPPRNTRIQEIHNIVFGTPYPKNNEDKFNIRSMRDSLHLDQCWSNMIDVFITDENRIIESRETLYEHGFDFQILRDDECVEYTHECLLQWYGSTEDQDLTKRIEDLSRPIIIGSCSAASISIWTEEEKPDLALRLGTNCVEVEAYFRDETGAPLLTIVPDTAAEFHQRTGHIQGSRGDGGLVKLANKNYDIVSVGTRADDKHPFWNPLDEVLLAAFVARSGHIVFYSGCIRDSKGDVRATISKESLTLTGASLGR
jgi:hypothetical protein